MNTNAFRFIAALSLTLAAVTVFLIEIPQKAPAQVAAAAQAQAPAQEIPEVSGDAAIVYDLRNGTVLFQKNATAQMPLASITKVMTVLVASEVLDPQENITIPAEALVREKVACKRAQHGECVISLILPSSHHQTMVRRHSCS